MKPDLFAFDAGHAMRVQAIAAMIEKIPNLDGVTFSGGEPFEQSSALARLARLLRPRLSILVYSGYTLAALRREPQRFGPLLDQTDILIDGEYRRELPGPFPWRGSANQVVHLSINGAPSVAMQRPARQIQVSLTDGRLRLSGFPDGAFETALARRLHERGIVLQSTMLSAPTDHG